jgi:hypothetical protein
MTRIEKDNLIEFRVNYMLHQQDTPARIWKASDSSTWYLNGGWHRYYGPAISPGNYWYIHNVSI